MGFKNDRPVFSVYGAVCSVAILECLLIKISSYLLRSLPTFSTCIESIERRIGADNEVKEPTRVLSAAKPAALDISGLS